MEHMFNKGVHKPAPDEATDINLVINAVHLDAKPMLCVIKCDAHVTNHAAAQMQMQIKKAIAPLSKSVGYDIPIVFLSPGISIEMVLDPRKDDVPK